MIPTGPAGVGGYGEGPPKEPLDATRPPPPECNIVSLSPCHDKCDTEDQARAIECAKNQDEAQRRACIDGSFEKFKSCTKECEKKRTCTDMYEACQGKGLPCTREIDAGMTLCGICLNDCLANRPYKYSECYKCGYE